VSRLDLEILKTTGLTTVRPGVADDLYVVCASYEPRAVVVSGILGTTYRARTGVIYVNREFEDGPGGNMTRASIQTLHARLRACCDTVSLARGSWLDAREQIRALADAFTTGPVNSVSLDVTTFNRESLLHAVGMLRMRFPACQLRVIYASPAKYGDWLSRGFIGIRNIMGLGCVQHASWPTLLVVLSGFEPERTQRAIEEYEPELVLLGIGDPPTSSAFLDRNVQEQCRFTFDKQNLEVFTFPADSAAGTRDQLQALTDRFMSTHNVVLVPQSTKLSTLGSYLFAEQHPEVQVSYCIPAEYNTAGYSEGVGDLFEERLPSRR